MALDRIERQILSLLQEQGRMSNVELAERIGLSESPCFRRVKRLERDGVIARYSAVVDQRTLGLSVTAFVLVNMDKQPDITTDDFLARVVDEPHIVECHAMSGSHDYIMKVLARDIDHFSELVMQGILKYPGVRHVESSFSLGEVKHFQALPT
ncbi:MAG: Lrp/AsnC family transcriptional regulator [Gammaproteobacteria bacterium]|nr:Lrp/AsnC family transcriptional regulator [Gammaproteobacteria bacterium]